MMLMSRPEPLQGRLVPPRHFRLRQRFEVPLAGGSRGRRCLRRRLLARSVRGLGGTPPAPAFPWEGETGRDRLLGCHRPMREVRVYVTAAVLVVADSVLRNSEGALEHAPVVEGCIQNCSHRR
jgi:hypothetical protein